MQTDTTTLQYRPSVTELVAYLKSNEILGKFNDAVLRDLAADMEWVSMHREETLFRQGEPGGAMYLVFHGRLQVSITQKDGSEMVVAEVGMGKLLGEIQFLSGGMRTATVSALQPSALLKLSRQTFDRLAEQNPEILKRMAELIRQRLRRDQLAAMLPNLFGQIDTVMLQKIEVESEWIYLPQGELLVNQGEPGDSFFLLISGRLEAIVQDKSGNAQVVGEVRRGEIVGEMSMFTGERRAASIYAARNSELVKFSKQAFEQIITLYPKAMMHIVRIIIKRLEQSQSSKSAEHSVLNITVVPTALGIPVHDFVQRLTLALSAYGKTLHLSSERLEQVLEMPGIAQTPEDAPNNIRLSAWLDEQETHYRVIIYETDMFASPWTKRCIQRADRLLIIAQSRANPIPEKIERALLGVGKSMTKAQRILIVLHPDGSQLPSRTQEWLSARQIDTHHHLRLDTEADFWRLARFLTGNAIGLVLGGGGARGLAHVGVIRALTEVGVPIDMIGGTSIGAAMAAQYAMGMTVAQMLEMNRKIWIEWKPFNDFTLPILSLIRGRKFEMIAQKVYGNTLIEDLWINYFCVSTNLTTTQEVIHRQGPLWKALRATASLPGIAVPFVEKNNLLVDGGVLNNLPIDVMRALSGGAVIAVSVSPERDLTVHCEQFPSPWKVLLNRIVPSKDQIEVPNIIDLLMRTTMVGSIYKTNALKMTANLYLQPPLDRFKLLDFKSLEEIIEVGYRYTRERLEELQKDGSFEQIFGFRTHNA